MTELKEYAATLLASGLEAPARELVEKPSTGESWIVTVYNNETNTYEEVMTVLMLATGCDAEEAYIEAWEVDHFGQCVVHRSDENECKGAADVIAVIGIRVEATPDS
ncbi:MAG: ATP-dependent Clp protease adaptor ClpS [Armatimonadetes bacterium]|nr:ATP-dependent Clp protease adaptor ClpS [Armatimonadota bacterium]